MIYHLSLQTAGIIAGVLLLVVGLVGVLKPALSSGLASRLPRSRNAGIVLLAIDLMWCFWLLWTMEMGEFSSFRKPLLFILPVGFFLVVTFVDEFLAVRALGILFLLGAEPLLDAAFFQNETSRLLVTVFAYLLIVAGLFWVMMPYVLRDQLNWSTKNSSRWRALHVIALLYGVAILACALTRY